MKIVLWMILLIVMKKIQNIFDEKDHAQQFSITLTCVRKILLVFGTVIQRWRLVLKPVRNMQRKINTTICFRVRALGPNSQRILRKLS